MRQVQPVTLLYSSLAYLLSNFNLLQPSVEVDTNYGRLRGTRALARDGRPYIEFLNIPYAKPPVGDLRYEPPELPNSWDEVQDATYYGNSCVQYEFLTYFLTGAEDCLNLNVYSHEAYEKSDIISSEKLKPVIVYFYGGYFMSGFSYIYRPKYFMEEDVVLVTVNYRVNSFGFLNTGDGVVHGNMGLKDQSMALRWVQENIKYFGGDPNSVTIMGQSAGSVSVHLHMLSNKSSGLFHKAISLSGTAVSSFALQTRPKFQAQLLARSVGCLNFNFTVNVPCMKTIPARRIARFHLNYLTPIPDPINIFSPTVEVESDDAFLTQDPRYLVSSGTFPNHVPWMVGVTNGEGSFFRENFLSRPELIENLNSDWTKRIAVGLKIQNRGEEYIKDVAWKIRQFYFGYKNITAETLKNSRDLFSDLGIYYGFYETINLHVNSSRAPTYASIYSYTRKYGVTKLLSEMLGLRIPRLIDYSIGASRTWLKNKVNPSTLANKGVGHSDDLLTLFNIPIVSEEITPGSEDYIFSASYVKLIVSFVRNGEPGKLFGTKWEPIPRGNRTSLELFDIGEFPRNVNFPFERVLEFWKSLNL